MSLQYSGNYISTFPCQLLWSSQKELLWMSSIFSLLIALAFQCYLFSRVDSDIPAWLPFIVTGHYQDTPLNEHPPKRLSWRRIPLFASNSCLITGQSFSLHYHQQLHHKSSLPQTHAYSGTMQLTKSIAKSLRMEHFISQGDSFMKRIRLRQSMTAFKTCCTDHLFDKRSITIREVKKRPGKLKQ